MAGRPWTRAPANGLLSIYHSLIAFPILRSSACLAGPAAGQAQQDRAAPAVLAVGSLALDRDTFLIRSHLL